MFRSEVNKQKQKSFDLEGKLNHPPNSLLSFMNRTHKITRVHTDNSDSKSISEQVYESNNHHSHTNDSQQMTRGKSKSVYQGYSATPQGYNTPVGQNTPDAFLDSLSIHNTKYAPSKFKLSANQLAQQKDKNIIEDFECFNCKNIQEEIKECLGCGHIFCKECVNTSDNACYDPECSFSFENQPNKRKLTWDMREPSKIIQKKINQLQFKCLNESLGCHNILDLKNYGNHVDQECEYMLTECPNSNLSQQNLQCVPSPSKFGCVYIGPKKYMHEHLQTCNVKQMTIRADRTKQNYNDEGSMDVKRFILTDDQLSQEDSNLFLDKAQLQQQNSQFASKIISIGDEYIQSQMDEIIDLSKKVSNQNSIINKQSEQIDKQSEENRKLKDQIDKLSKETDLRISKLQASSTQVMLEMQYMKKNYSDKISELYQLVRELKGDNNEKQMMKSQSGGGFSKQSHHPLINNSLMNQTLISQINSDRSENGSLQNTKYFSSNQIIAQEAPFNNANSENKSQNFSMDIKIQQHITPHNGSLFTAKLEEIKSQNGENSNRNNKYQGQQYNGQYMLETFDTCQSEVSSNKQYEMSQSTSQFHSCKQCQSKLVYTPKQFLNACAKCNTNRYGIYYCQNCSSRFYCLECCPLYLKKGFCPNNHNLSLQLEVHQQQGGGFIHRCNICSRIFTDNKIDKQYSCSNCDFDICSGCMNMRIDS